MRILLLWFPHIANVDLPRKICYVTPCLLFLEDQFQFCSFFLLNSYHFIVIVETKEPLEIFPICLKHSELQDDKCAILIDFFGAYFWSSGCSQFRQRATKGRHMATKGAMMGSSGIIMANGRPRVVTGFNAYVSEPSDTSEHLDTSEHSDMRKGHKREKRNQLSCG